VYAPHKLINPTEHVNWQLGDVYDPYEDVSNRLAPNENAVKQPGNCKVYQVPYPD